VCAWKPGPETLPKANQRGLLIGRAADGYVRVQTWLASGASLTALKGVADQEKLAWCGAGMSIRRAVGLHLIIDLLDHFALFNWKENGAALEVLEKVANAVMKHAGGVEHANAILCLAALNKCNVLRAMAMKSWETHKRLKAATRSGAAQAELQRALARQLLHFARAELQRALAPFDANILDPILRAEFFNGLAFFAEAEYCILGRDAALQEAIMWFDQSAQESIRGGTPWVDEYSNSVCHASRLQLKASGGESIARKVECRLLAIDGTADRLVGGLTLRSEVSRDMEFVKLYTAFPQIAAERGICRGPFVHSLTNRLTSPSMLPRTRQKVVDFLGSFCL